MTAKKHKLIKRHPDPELQESANTSPSKKNPLEYLKAYGVFFITYFVYLLTVYPTVGTEDSGEFIVSAATLDIAHPPGYPLHTLIGYLFSVLVPFGNIGWRVNLLSAFFGAAAAAILYLLLRRLTKNWLLAVAGALFFAFNDIFWAQAIRTEVYTLSTFFFMLISYLLLVWDEKQQNKYLYWGAYLYGLSWTNSYPVMALAGPPIVIYVISRNWRVIKDIKLIIGTIFLFMAGLLVYAYLPLRTYLGPYDNPAYIQHTGLHTWESFMKFVNRAIYGGMVNTITAGAPQLAAAETQQLLPPWLLEIAGVAIGLIKKIIDGSTAGLLLYFKIILEQLIYFPVLFLIPGFFFMFREAKKYSVYIIACLIFYTCFQVAFVGINAEASPFTLHSNRPFYISAIIVVCIITFLGVEYIYRMLKNSRREIRLTTTILILIPVIPLFINFYGNNESGNYIAYDFNKNVLDSLPPNGNLISIGRDNHTFVLYYLKKIDHYRTDTNVEIYYYAGSPQKSYIDLKLKEKNASAIYFDLLPSRYIEIGFKPYKFLFKYGEDQYQTPPPEQFEQYKLRGMRPNMDYPNSRLIGLFYEKTALNYFASAEKVQEYFQKILNEMPMVSNFRYFINDYLRQTYQTGMF